MEFAETAQLAAETSQFGDGVIVGILTTIIAVALLKFAHLLGEDRGFDEGYMKGLKDRSVSSRSPKKPNYSMYRRMLNSV